MHLQSSTESVQTFKRRIKFRNSKLIKCHLVHQRSVPNFGRPTKNSRLRKDCKPFLGRSQRSNAFLMGPFLNKFANNASVFARKFGKVLGLSLFRFKSLEGDQYSSSKLCGSLDLQSHLDRCDLRELLTGALGGDLRRASFINNAPFAERNSLAKDSLSKRSQAIFKADNLADYKFSRTLAPEASLSFFFFSLSPPRLPFRLCERCWQTDSSH